MSNVENERRGPKTPSRLGTRAHQAMKKRASRSRNGCSRCKERRLKCDETRPACQQCQSRKQTCPGYQTPMRWSAKYEVFGVHQQPSREHHTTSTRVSHQPPGVAQAEESRQHAQAPVQEPNVADSAASLVGDLPGQHILVGSLLPAHNASQSLANDTIEDPPYHSRGVFDPTLSITSPLDGLVADEGGLAPFALTDHDFWSSLTLDWFPGSLETPQALRSTPPVQIDPSAVETTSSIIPNHRELPSFDPSEVTDEDSKVLFKHYFDNIMSINSVYDNQDNPFRYLVSRYIKSSPLIRSCVLSISEMHLVSNDRTMHQKVVRYHSEALKRLAIAMAHLDSVTASTEQSSTSQSGAALAGRVDRMQEALLALLLLGVSASWLDPSNIGVNHLMSARRLFTTWLNAAKLMSGVDARSSIDERDTSFIIGAMAYWEATVSFVSDQAIDAVDYLEPFCHQDQRHIIYPNPWTGVGTPIFIVIARLGVYVRQKLIISKLQLLGWPPSTYCGMLEKLLQRAADLERFVLEYEAPTRDKVASNPDSPLDEFSELESMTHTYRLAAILELYRSFPQLGGRDDHQVIASRDIFSFNLSPVSMSLAPVDEATDDTSTGQQETSRIIYELAINLLGLLKQTGERRATSLAHTLALLIGGSALQHLPSSDISGGPGVASREPVCMREKVTDVLAKLDARIPVVEGWRSFVRQRLKSNADFVGLESFRRTQKLMEEIWSRLDSKTEDFRPLAQQDSALGRPPLAVGVSAHWLEVMKECRLETLFG